MEKYKKYKDSGVEWLGKIPEHWEVDRLAKFGVFFKGNGISKKMLVEKGLPALLYGDLYTKYDIKTSQIINRISESTAKKSKYITGGEIIFTGSGETLEDIGKSIAYLGKEKVYVGGDTIIYQQKSIESEFLAYCLVSQYVSIQKIINSKGSIIFHVYSSRLRTIKIAIPTLKEQIQIANYLDTKTTAIDKKIKLLKRKTQHYKAYRKTLINDAVTKGLNKNVELKESGIDWIGKIPGHWEVKRYKSFGRTIKGKNMEISDVEFENSLPLLSLKYLRNDFVQHPTFCYSFDKSLKSTEDDLIIVWDGAAVGEILKSKVGYISSTIAKLDIDERKYNKKYFYHLRGAIDYILKQIPTGMGIPHLNPTLFRNFKCPAPPISEQQQIADYLDSKTAAIDKILKNVETQIITLKELRKTLINEVVTGKVKVSSDLQ